MCLILNFGFYLLEMGNKNCLSICTNKNSKQALYYYRTVLENSTNIENASRLVKN